MKKYSFFRQIIVVVMICLFTTNVNATHFTDFEFVETAPASVRQTMQKNVNAVFKQIHEAYFDKRPGISLSKNNATQQAIRNMEALWSTSKFYCVETEIITQVLQVRNGWQVRNIPVCLNDFENAEEKYQDLVLEFSPNGTISDMYTAIPAHQYRIFIENANDVTDLRRRQLVLSFVEDFRTAHNRKDINFIETVYSNDALIIIGKVLERRGDSPEPTVVYETRSKEEYIRRLKGAFDKNQFVNIKFDEITVVKDKRDSNIYGVTLRQHWNTSSYNDEGWLFLMIDFRNENTPMIWVRTWQPLEIARNRVFDNYDFDFY